MKPAKTCAIMRAMTKTSLANKLEKELPAELAGLVRTASSLAESRGQSLYLVGGMVRDLLLDKPNFDLDLVVEGDAIELARELAEVKSAKLTTHPRFRTATLTWASWSVDFATARSETYAQPGALPTVKPGSIEADLLRRDFTINAMAILLNTNRYGELIDRHLGQNDLKEGLIRVLHEKSFIDDATRIWRGLRYERRFDFQFEETTLKLLKRDIPMLDTISGDRIRYELECVFREEAPEKVFRRADELGVLQILQPALAANDWLAEKFKSARKLASPKPPSFGLYLALLTYHLGDEDRNQMSSFLRLPKPVANLLRDTQTIKANLKILAYPELKLSYVYRLLHGLSSQSIMVSSIAAASPIARQHLEIYLHKLRYVKSALNGDDLKRMGFAPGPRIRKILALLQDARLDGKVNTRQDEEAFVMDWLDKTA